MNEPIEDKYNKAMNKIGEMIDNTLNADLENQNREHGFALLVFPFENKIDSRVSYLSNANREDMITAMKEFIARAEGTYIESGSVH